MKLSKLKTFQNHKLFKYNLLKLQVYSKKTSYDDEAFLNNWLDQIEAYLKQVLKIIFEYHACQFKILFIGFPVICKMKQLKLIHFTNHSFITEKSWISGIFRNRFSILTYLKLMQSQNFSGSLQLLLNVNKKPHLVVVLNKKLEASIINEFYKAGIPILSFDWDFLKTPKVVYKALGNYYFVEKNLKLTFFFLFYSLLKKTPFRKKK